MKFFHYFFRLTLLLCGWIDILLKAFLLISNWGECNVKNTFLKARFIIVYKCQKNCVYKSSRVTFEVNKRVPNFVNSCVSHRRPRTAIYSRVHKSCFSPTADNSGPWLLGLETLKTNEVSNTIDDVQKFKTNLTNIMSILIQSISMILSFRPPM